MIYATNPEQLNELPKPSIRTGWSKTTAYAGPDYLTDGRTLVLAAGVKAKDRRMIEGRLEGGRDRATLVEQIFTGQLQAVKDFGSLPVEFLGCAKGEALLKYLLPSDEPALPWQRQATLESHRLAYAVYLTNATDLRVIPARRWQNMLMLYRADELVGIVYVEWGK